jgi:hypothetical protein
VLDFHHLGNEVGHLDKPFIGIAAGQDKLDMGRFVFNELDDFIRFEEFKVDSNIDFIQHHEVVATADDSFPGGGEGGYSLFFFFRVDIAFIDKLA